MGQFYGWERPLWFGSPEEPKPTFGTPDWFENVRREVMAAHRKAAVFDGSPFGKIEVTGPDAAAFLQQVCANDMDRPPGSAIYTPMLNERGTYESDIIAHRLAEDRYRLFTGAGAIRKDLAWLRRHAEGFDVTLADVHGNLRRARPDGSGLRPDRRATGGARTQRPRLFPDRQRADRRIVRCAARTCPMSAKPAGR